MSKRLLSTSSLVAIAAVWGAAPAQAQVQVAPGTYGFIEVESALFNDGTNDGKAEGGIVIPDGVAVDNTEPGEPAILISADSEGDIVVGGEAVDTDEVTHSAFASAFSSTSGADVAFSFAGAAVGPGGASAVASTSFTDITIPPLPPPGGLSSGPVAFAIGLKLDDIELDGSLIVSETALLHATATATGEARTSTEAFNDEGLAYARSISLFEQGEGDTDRFDAVAIGLDAVITPVGPGPVDIVIAGTVGATADSHLDGRAVAIAESAGTLDGEFGGGAQAYADAISELHVEAVALGVVLDVEGVLPGGIALSGTDTIFADAHASTLLAADATASVGTGEFRATAQAFAIGEADTVATSFGVAASLGGLAPETGPAFTSSATIRATASAHAVSDASASASGFSGADDVATARAMSAGGWSFYQSGGVVVADAVGIELDAGVIEGDIVQEGHVAAEAAASALARATAQSTGSAAEVDAQTGISIAVANGFQIFAESIDGDIHNYGTIEAHATSQARSETEARGDAGWGTASSRTYGAYAGASGLSVSAGVINGDVVNFGTDSILVSATAGSSAIAEASSAQGGADASAYLGGATAEAGGLMVDSWSGYGAEYGVHGDILNLGAIDVSARADTEGFATAQAAGGATTETLQTGRTQAFGLGMAFGGFTFEGTFGNEGTIFVDVVGTLDLTAHATGSSGSAHSVARGRAVDAYGFGMLYSGGSLLGGLVANSGSIETGVGVAIDVSSRAESAQSAYAGSFVGGGRAYGFGILADFGFGEGDIVNSAGGVIDVTATVRADVDATAVAGESFVSGSASAAIGGCDYSGQVFECWDGSLAEATGIAARFGHFEGDIGNAGDIFATAILNQSATATVEHGDFSFGYAEASIDGGIARATGIDVAIYGLATLEGDVFNTGRIAVAAHAENEAVASIAIEGDPYNDYANARAGGSVGAQAFGILVRSGYGPVDGDIYSAGEGSRIDALATNRTSATVQNAGGGFGATQVEANGHAHAAGILVAVPFVSGDVYSASTITATALNEVEATAQGPGGEYGDYASGWGYTEAAGIVVIGESAYYGEGPGFGPPGVVVGGSVLNIGDMQITAQGSATTFSTGGGNAQMSAGAAGVYVIGGVGSGIGNSGLIEGTSEATAHLETREGYAGAFAQTAGLFAQGPYFGADADGRAVFNDGVIISQATARATAEWENYGGAFAEATAHGIEVRGSGYYYPRGQGEYGLGEVGIVVGDIVNTEGAGILAFADAAATATGESGLASARAIGIGVYDIEVDGSVGNHGAIFAQARTGGDYGERGAVGILIDRATVGGTVFNSGTIVTWAEDGGRADAINTRYAYGDTEINQLDGLLVGDIRLSVYGADTFNISGGDLQRWDSPEAPLNLGTTNNIYGGLDYVGGEGEYGEGGTYVRNDTVNFFAGVDQNFDYDGNIYDILDLNINLAESSSAVQVTLRGEVRDTTNLNVNDHGTLIVGGRGAINPDFGVPTTSAATIFVNNYTQSSLGTILFEITPDPSDVGWIEAYGGNTITLAGAIGVVPVPGLYDDYTEYEVVFSDHRVGAYDEVLKPAFLLDLDVLYRDLDGGGDSAPPNFGWTGDGPVENDVVLALTRVPFDVGCDGRAFSFNQCSVSGAIERIYDPGDPYFAGSDLADRIIQYMFLIETESEYQRTLDKLHGSEHAQFLVAGLDLAGLLTNAMNERLSLLHSSGGVGATQMSGLSFQVGPQYASASVNGLEVAQAVPSPGAVTTGPGTPGAVTVWGQVIGRFGDASGDQEAWQFDTETFAASLGADYQLTPEFVIGVAGLYQNSDVRFRDNDRTDVDGFQIGVYGSWDSGTWFADGMMTYGWFDVSTERRVDIPIAGFDEIARSSYDARAFQAALQVGYSIRADRVLFQPIAGLSYTHLRTDSFTERGAGPANLVVDGSSVDSLVSRLGGRVSGQFDAGGVLLIPEARAFWLHEFGDRRRSITAAFTEFADTTFDVVSATYGRDRALLGAGLTVEFGGGIQAFIDYEATVGGDYQSHQVLGGLSFQFGY